MLLSEVGKFFAAFTVVVGTAAILWLITAAGDPPRGARTVDTAPAAAAAKPDAASHIIEGEARASGSGGQGFDAEGLTLGVRMPFGAFAFGWQIDRQ